MNAQPTFRPSISRAYLQDLEEIGLKNADDLVVAGDYEFIISWLTAKIEEA